MGDIKFSMTPGYILDLMYIFIFHFNNQEQLRNYLIQKSAKENREFFDHLEYEFSQIPDDLLLFFYLKEDKKCFLLQYCFYNNFRIYQEDFQFENMQKDLLDIENILSSMIQFFFPQLRPEEIDQYREDFKKLINLINDSQYSDFIKVKLCLFFTNYESIIRKLNYELISKEALFRQYYDKNYVQIADFQDNLILDTVIQKMSKVDGNEYIIDSKLPIYVCPCIIARDNVNICFWEKGTFILLGVECESLLDYLQERVRVPELDVFGTAISEKNRVGILNALLTRDEMTIREIEKMFDISNTNAYYHLNLMLKANVLNVRNEGRAMLYSLNRSYFDTLSEVLKIYGTRKRGEKR